MSERLHYFKAPAATNVVALPFSLDELIGEWNRLRVTMTRKMPAAFSRDEWAYLITFLSAENLSATFEQTFGRAVATPSLPIRTMARPRGLIAVWLPNNVSLLGPLATILLSLTGNPLRLKGGSHTEDLTGAFLSFACENLPPGLLKSYLAERVSYETFERDDPRHREMASQAAVRIVFGSDAAAEAIHALPHPLESCGFSFADRRSEAWVEPQAATEQVLRDLLKVFAVYGQAGCTSPRRVVLLNADLAAAVAMRDRLVEMWPQVVPRLPEMHAASESIMARQWAAAVGWDARLVARNAAVLATAPLGTSEFDANSALMIVPAAVDEAVASLPANIQTVGYCFAAANDRQWLEIAARTRVKRLVPVAAMHHFGPVWDGQAFWRGAFEEIEIGSSRH